MAENTPLTDRTYLEQSLTGYTPPTVPDLPQVAHRSPNTPMPGQGSAPSALTSLENFLLTKDDDGGKLTGGGIRRTLAEVTSSRYDNFMPGNYNNEDAYAQGQGWSEKMVNGVGKGLLLTGTTFLQSTVGFVNGLARWAADGRAASFYDNDFNRQIDEINKRAEDAAPNYYTDVERSARWYSPTKLFSANFFWDGIVKNLGYAAGAYFSGGVYAFALKALPLTSRLFAAGKAAETLAATEQGLLAANKVAETYGKVKSLSDSFLTSYKAMNAGGRALVAGLSTTGEAGFEAFHNMNQYRDSKINEWKEANFGEEPIGADLDKINREAEDVGNSSFLLNVGLLSATNYIQFPKILGSSYKAEKGMVNNLTKEINEVVTDAAGNLIEKKATTTFGKLLNGVNKIRPYTFSVSEGIEEGSQFAISVSTEDYYNKKNKGEATSFLESLSQGITQTLGTDEGMENVLIGGLSGAIMQARGTYRDAGERSRNTIDAIQQINKFKLSDFVKDTTNSINRGTAIQEERENHLRQGDILESKDSEADYIINYLTPRIKYGRTDLVTSDLKDYRQLAMTDEGFAQLQSEGKALPTDTREGYLKRLSNIEATTENMQSLYESLTLRYGGLRTKDDKALYPSEVFDKMLYAATKVADYDNRLPSLTSQLLSDNITTDAIAKDLIEGNSESYNAALSSIENSKAINVDEKVQALKDFGEITLRRQKFLQEYTDIKNSPQEYKEEEEVAPTNKLVAPTIKDGEKVATVTVTTKDGEEKLEIGTEYFVGVVERNKDGLQVTRFPKLTILGETEDGEIQIKDSDGVLRNISKESLAGYKLGKVSDTLNNKKAKYFAERINTIFEFNFGKGNKVQGRLQYTSKTGALEFVYKDKKGKIKTIEVTGDQFVAQKNFKDPMIKKVGLITLEEENAAKELAKDAKADPRLIAKREARLKILNDLFDELSTNQDKTTSLISKKQEDVDRIKKELASLEKEIANAQFDKRAKNSVRFKSATKKALANAIRLSRMQTQLENEIEKLQSEQEEIEFNLSYVSDIVDNIDLMPTDSADFLEELNDQVIDLEILQEKVGKQISVISKLLKETEKALNTAIDFITDLINKFENKFPNVPRIMGQDFVDFLKVNPNFLKLKPYYREELSELEDLIANVEDADITPSEAKMKALNEHLDVILGELADLQKETVAKQLVLDKFQEVADRYKEQEAEKKKIQANEVLLTQFLGTLGGYTQTQMEDRSYEVSSKKSDKDVITSTRPTSDNQPFNIRANRFGFNFPSLANKEDIRGVVVTTSTQDEIIPGLTSHLLANATKEQKEKYDVKDIIVLVITDKNGNPVDENGVTIPEGADLLNTAIYQVFPTSELMGMYNGKYDSMFRKTSDPKTVDSLKKQYTEWRNTQLKKDTLGKPQPIATSFGIPEYVTRKNEKGDAISYDTRNSVQDSGLIVVDETRDDLTETQAVIVATSNEPLTHDNTTFENVAGGVFLKVTGGLYKLFNRKFNNTEANVIFDAIRQLSDNALREGKVGSESTNLINWLKSVVYWGINRTQEGDRKKAGYNSIWFETVNEDGKKVTRLFISGKETDSTKQFEFTPTGLDNRKDEIIALLSNMYSNTDAKLTAPSTYNKPYFQVTGIGADGNPTTLRWPNYQSYLLSNKSPDAQGKLTVPRKSEDIPLTTPIRTLKDSDDVNKNGFYFKLTGPTEFTFVSEVPKAETPAPVVSDTEEAKPEAPKEKKAEGKYDLDGKTVHNIKLAGNTGSIDFTANIDNITYNAQTGEVSGEIAIDADAVTKNNIATILKSQGKIAEDASASEVEQAVKGQMFAKVISEIKPQLETKALVELKPEIIEAAPVEIPVTEEEVTEQNNTLNDIISSVGDIAEDEDDEVYRIELAERTEMFTPEKWEDVKAFIAKVLPTVPFYRVKNLIEATNGRQAFGMFKAGAIYVYENAEIGTAYHEVFEAVWKMFSDSKERKAILDEFKNRQGTFVDRETGTTIKYSEATSKQAKEQLAEEFREFVLTGKVQKIAGSKSFISRLFSDLVNFIKEFFTGENAISNTEKLFEKITSGYYAQYNPYESKLSYADKGIIDIETAEAGGDAEFRIKTIPAQQVSDIVDHMAYSTLAELSKTNESLFNAGAFENKSVLLARLKNEILLLVAKQVKLQNKNIQEGRVNQEQGTRDIANMVDLYNKIQSEWEGLSKRYEEKLKTLSIEFDENDNLLRTDEDNSGKADYIDARKIDSFRKSNGAIKLLFGTLAETTVKDGKIVKLNSSIGGAKLIPADRVYITLKNALYDSLSIDDMFKKLKEMGEVDPNYAVLYHRVTRNNINDETLDFSKLQEHDLQLISAFWKAMKGQNADVLSVFILPSGEVVIGDSNLSQASRQAKRQLTNDMVASIKVSNPYIEYDSKTKTYSTARNAKGEKVIDNYKLSPSQLQSYVSFLEKLGINFKLSDIENKLNSNQRNEFIDVVNRIKDSLSSINKIATLSPNTLKIDGRLLQLGTIQSIIENPEFESTYFNINGERTQTYLGTNALSNLHDVLSKIKNIKELEGTEYAYLLTDVFSKGEASVMLNKMFNVGTTGNRKSETEDLMRPVYIDGTINEKKNKKKESSKLTIKERIVQEMNLNLSGVFMNLVPGDASIEWAIRMFKKESPFVTKEEFDTKDYLNIFKNYFISEVNLAIDGRKTPRDNGKDLRFFKDILGDKYKEVWNKESVKIANKEGEGAISVYDKHKSIIDKAVQEFIKQEAEDTRDLLDVFGIAKFGEEGLMVEDLLLTENEYISEEDLSNKLEILSTNYIIANIEMHKLLYSDPYQYKDELKRIKNFNSPRQPLLSGSSKLNTAFDKVYNKFFSKDDIGHTDMTQEVFRSTVIADVLSTNDLPGYEVAYEETDGGGYISEKANRIFGIRSGEWTPANEAQYRYDIAYQKTVKGLPLTEAEQKFQIKKITKPDGSIIYKGKNPNVKSTYTTRKPIVTGSKADGKNYNDVVLDKFALTPLSFRVLHELNPNSNALKLYEKMQKENVDYAVYSTGRKVGAGLATPLYNIGGSFNTNPFEEINNIPFSIMGVQAEVPSKETAEVTQGSQITKLVTLDMMEAGMPIDFMSDEKDFNKRYVNWVTLEDKESYNNGDNIYKEIKNNQKLLEEKIKIGYEILLKKLGIKQRTDDSGEAFFEITDADKLIDTLTDEILKREVNENIIEAFEEFKRNNNIILEATPAYQQIRNILYSIADKNITSQKISGGSKVQVSSALLESVRAEGKQIPTNDGKIKYSYESKDLKFYEDEDGKRVCEIMLGRWFKSNKTDAELLEYFNNTPEGQKILSGVAFRTPTQKQNSIDVFKIKQFLPESFGDNVIVPSALVKKAGSDFDIDKLSIYLKGVYEDERGNILLIKREGSEEQSKKQYEDLYRKNILSKFDKVQNTEKFKNDLLTMLSKIESVQNNELEFENEAEEQFYNDNKEVLQQIINQAAESEVNPTDYINSELSKIEGRKEELVSKLFNKNLKENFIDSMYKKAVENEYIESLEKLISHPLNFSNLIKPNSAKELNDLSDEIVELLGEEKIDYSSVGNMLSRKFMSQLRQDFVSGKYAIGIAATAQTNHSLDQRSLITIKDVETLLDEHLKEDKEWLGDGKVKLPHNVINDNGKIKSTLSMIYDRSEKSISDVIGQFIDGFVDIAKGPWIMKLGATPNVVGTWLFLTRLGVPIKTTAYFMNQPIIKDYLRNIQSDGYSYLFMDQYVIDANEMYASKKDISNLDFPSESDLRKMVGNKKLDDVQKAQQQLILKEFLKYAKMAEHLFKVQQSSNFDTATFNDPYLIFKKKIQLAEANNTIISSVNDLLKNSFIDVLKDTLYDVRDAFAKILLSDKKGRIRDVMESVLLPYVNKSDRDFIKISQKAVSSLFDWVMLNNTTYNTVITSTLLGTDTEKSAARQIIEFRDKMIKSNSPIKDNLILKSLKMEAGEKVGKPDNLYIAGRDNKTYDQNLIIDAFRQLKDALGTENKDLYGKLVRLAVLQSGLTTSPISFTSLLPYEDFNKIYNDSLSTLEKIRNLGDFKKLNVFERTNWSNSDAVPFKSAKLVLNKNGGMTNINEDFINKNLKDAYKEELIPKVVNISRQSLEGRSDFITYSWQSKYMQDPNDPDKMIRVNKKSKADARRRGDYSYIKKALMQKVYYKNDKGVLVPLIQTSEYKGKEYFNYVYKHVNAWGDSFRANESYANIRPSVLDNGYEVAKEVDDNVIVDVFNKALPTKQKREQKSIALRGGMVVAPSELSEGLLEYLGYSQSEIKDMLAKYKTPSIESTTGVNLKDGNSYTPDQLNTKMLLAMGYTSQEAGKIIKNNKC